MPVSIDVSFAFELDQPTDVLLQFEAAPLPEQKLLSTSTMVTPTEHFARVAAEDDIGERIWLRAEGLIEIDYNTEVEVQRHLPDLAALGRLDPHDLPGEAVQYLMDSRYCPADRFQNFVAERFGKHEGGAKIVAMRDWITDEFSYVPGSSNADTGALDSFVLRQGVCRDYSHVLVSLARAAGIPARYVSCFAPGVDPPDFHAVAEVFLANGDDPAAGGTWQIVDATGMADPAETVKIGVGRDAADVSFLTSFGPSQMARQSVCVQS